MRKYIAYCLTTVLFLVFSLPLLAQPKYRTFNQNDLAKHKNNAGKAISSSVCFHFVNKSGHTATSLHARFNSDIVSIQDAGGFSLIVLDHKKKVINASGTRTVAPDDSVVFCATFEKKAPGTHVNFWSWDSASALIGTVNTSLASSSDSQNIAEPNGGYVREYLYKKVLRRPSGLRVGIPTDTPMVGWIRYTSDDRKYFPHTGPPRCFDLIVTGEGRTRPFYGKLYNPHVRKHNNRLLGELHAMKLAIVANDSGVTEPNDASTRFGDLIFLQIPPTACNGLTIREIAHLADSALTYCKHTFSTPFPTIYDDLDSCIRMINMAFDGPYDADSLHPLHIKGTHTLADAPFLHPNPSIGPIAVRRHDYSMLDEQPERFALSQNFPNPFNPSTTIEFYLVEPSVVTLKVYNLLGQEVATLVNHESMEDGNQSVEFDAANLTSGIYLYKITAQGTGDAKQQFQAIKKMVLLK